MEGISPIRGNMVNDLHLVLKKLYIYNHKQVIHFSAKSKETWYFYVREGTVVD